MSDDDENILFTHDGRGIQAKRAAFERLLYVTFTKLRSENSKLWWHVNGHPAPNTPHNQTAPSCEICDKVADVVSGWYQERDQLRTELAAFKVREAKMRDALKPLAALDPTRFKSIAPKDTWLWKPSCTGKDLPGLSLAHVLAAREALSTTPLTADLGSVEKAGWDAANSIAKHFPPTAVDNGRSAPDSD